MMKPVNCPECGSMNISAEGFVMVEATVLVNHSFIEYCDDHYNGNPLEDFKQFECEECGYEWANAEHVKK